MVVVVRNSATGEILRGDAAPTADEMDDWLAKNPGYEVVSRDALSDSEDEDDHKEEGKKEEGKKEDEFEGLKLFFQLFNFLARTRRGATQPNYHRKGPKRRRRVRIEGPEENGVLLCDCTQNQREDCEAAQYAGGG